MGAYFSAMTNTQHIQPCVGIDIGKVIMAPVKGGKSDTSFLSGTLEQAMRTPPSPGAFEGVRALVDAFEGRAWLVSKCGAKVQHKTRLWLEHWDFFEATGMEAKSVRFCLKRPQKADHCAELGITHFIDDRLDVLECLRGLVSNLYLFGEQRNADRTPDWAVCVADWAGTTKRVLEDLENDR